MNLIPITNLVKDFKGAKQALYTTLDTLLTDNKDINSHLEYHRNWRASIGGTIGGLVYRATTNDINKETLQKIQVISSLGTILFNNVDILVDEGFIQSQTDQIDLIKKYSKILQTGDKVSFEDPKLNELGIIAQEINRRINESNNPQLYLDSYEQLALAVIEQQSNGSEQRTSLPDNKLLLKFENRLESKLEGFEDSKNLNLASRIGAYTMAVCSSIPYCFDESLNTSMFESSLFLGASGQLRDDMLDYKKDLKKEQYTFMTASENPQALKQKVKALEKDLHRTCFTSFGLDTTAYSHMKLFDLAFNMLNTAFSFDWVSNSFDPNQDFNLKMGCNK